MVKITNICFRASNVNMKSVILRRWVATCTNVLWIRNFRHALGGQQADADRRSNVVAAILKVMTSYQKSDSVSRCIFTWRTILPNFIQTRFETMKLLKSVTPTKTTTKGISSRWKNRKLTLLLSFREAVNYCSKICGMVLWSNLNYVISAQKNTQSLLCNHKKCWNIYLPALWILLHENKEGKTNTVHLNKMLLLKILRTNKVVLISGVIMLYEKIVKQHFVW